MEKLINCKWVTETKTRKSDKEFVSRKCYETVVLRKGLGKFLIGVCPAGHLNHEKIK